MENFRAELILRAMAAKNVFFSTPLFLAEPLETTDDWSWEHQESWADSCSSGHL